MTTSTSNPQTHTDSNNSKPFQPGLGSYSGSKSVESWSRTWSRGMLGGLCIGTVFGSTYALWNNIPVTMPLMSQGITGGLSCSIYCLSHRYFSQKRGKQAGSRDVSDRLLAGAFTGCTASLFTSKGSLRSALSTTLIFSVGGAGLHAILDIMADLKRSHSRRRHDIAANAFPSPVPSPISLNETQKSDASSISDTNELGSLQEDIENVNYFLRLLVEPLVADLEKALCRYLKDRKTDHAERIALWKSVHSDSEKNK